MRLTLLLDVDNTLLDNDAAKREIDRRIRDLLGAPETARFWRLYEAVRRDTGVVSYPLTLAAFAEDARAHQPLRPGGEGEQVASLRRLAELLLDFPYDRFVFPHALETIARLRALGRVVILSDGDPTYQPLKIARSGLSAAVEGYVLVYPHKEEHLRELTAAFVADHYVLVDDKPAVIDKVRARLTAPLTTVFVRQGKYAAGAAPDWCGADIVLEEIGELRQFDAPRLLARAGRALVERDAALATRDEADPRP